MFVLESVLTTSSFIALCSDLAGLGSVSIALLTSACCLLTDLLLESEGSCFREKLSQSQARERQSREGRQLLTEPPQGLGLPRAEVSTPSSSCCRSY